MIRLSEPAPLYSEDSSLSAISPVCLPWSSNNPARFLSDGDKTVITGWGAATDNKVKLSRNLLNYAVSNPILEQVMVPVANNKCSAENNSFFQIDKNIQLCAGAESGTVGLKYNCTIDFFIIKKKFLHTKMLSRKVGGLWGN